MDGQKDFWDKLSASSGMIAAILVPVAVAFVGAQYSASLRHQELEATSRREYINIALTILRDPGTDDSLREWGTKIINHYADVEMSPSTKAAFNTGGQILPPALQTALLPPVSVPLSLPGEGPGEVMPAPPSAQSHGGNDSGTGRAAEPPATSAEPPSASPAENDARSASALTSTQRLSKINFWQTQGIKALLDRDLDQAVKAYRNAYALWPEFRNVDEIQRFLKSPKSSPKNDEEWKNLYKQITRYDLRGVDPAVIERLRQQAQQN